MGCYWGDSKKERAGGVGEGFGKETVGFLGEHVDGVLSFVRHWGILVPLIGCVEVAVGEGVKEEVGGGPATGVRLVVVLNCVGVEELAGVVGVVSGFLEPDGEVIGVEPLREELGIAAC